MTIRSKQIDIEELKDWMYKSINKSYLQIASELPKKTPISQYTVATTMRTGYCSEKTYKILKKYFGPIVKTEPKEEEAA